MNREELELIIAGHTRWLADHSEPLAQIIWQVGHQADLHGTDLHKADFFGAGIRGTDVREVILD